jgi:hypothetical protein
MIAKTAVSIAKENENQFGIWRRAMPPSEIFNKETIARSKLKYTT